MPSDDAHSVSGSFGVMLLYWVAAFTVWEIAASRWDVGPPWLAQSYARMVCAVLTVSAFSLLAANPPSRPRLVAIGLLGAGLVSACAWLAFDRLLWRPLEINIGLLAAAFSAGALLGDTVDSTEYEAPMLFAATVDSAVRLWAGGWLAPVGQASTACALRFPMPVTGALTPVFLPAELLFLAVFLRALERLQIGPSRFNFACSLSLSVFCFFSGFPFREPFLEPLRCPLLVVSFMALRWLTGLGKTRLESRRVQPWRPLAFGLALAGCMSALSLATRIPLRP